MTKTQQHYNWIMNIIDSCLHDFHFDCVDALIELFKQHHADEALYTCLQQLRNDRWNAIHTILN